MTQPAESLRDIAMRGLWTDNPGLVQLLGLCPLLAVSNTLINGLALGIATIAVLMATNGLVSLARGWIRHEIRLPAFVLIIAAFVSVVELLFKAYAFEMYLSLGIFLPLIVTNCAILARAESFASRRPVLPSLVDGLAHGTGFALVLVVLGGARELLGKGTLLTGADQLFGPGATRLEVHLLEQDAGLLLASAPLGAFIGLALLIALRNWLLAHRQRKADQ
jgi:electron transport complex protein RnfE